MFGLDDMAFAVLGSALIGGATGLASAGVSASAQGEANKVNISEAQKDRDWQERMSSTAHQREVEDLKAAGLNPILSANAGAGGGSGSTARVESTQKNLAQHLATAKLYSDIALQTQINKTEKTKQNVNVELAKKALQEQKSIQQDVSAKQMNNKVLKNETMWDNPAVGFVRKFMQTAGTPLMGLTAGNTASKLAMKKMPWR